MVNKPKLEEDVEIGEYPLRPREQKEEIDASINVIRHDPNPLSTKKPIISPAPKEVDVEETKQELSDDHSVILKHDIVEEPLKYEKETEKQRAKKQQLERKEKKFDIPTDLGLFRNIFKQDKVKVDKRKEKKEQSKKKKVIKEKPRSFFRKLFQYDKEPETHTKLEKTVKPSLENKPKPQHKKRDLRKLIFKKQKEERSSKPFTLDTKNPAAFSQSYTEKLKIFEKSQEEKRHRQKKVVKKEFDFNEAINEIEGK